MFHNFKILFKVNKDQKLEKWMDLKRMRFNRDL